jgi:peptidoglycan/LPS O-acetylase OafA/YrhL
MAAKDPQSHKLLYLESLRGLAELMVVATHFAGCFFPAITGGGQYPIHEPLDLIFYSTPLIIFFDGNFAVCIFFVISGFVLTRSFFNSGRHEILAEGALKRYWRLMPPVALSVAIAFIMMRLHLFVNGPTAAITGSQGLAALWTFIPYTLGAVKQAFFDAFITGSVGDTSYNPVLWTMQYEFLGSFIVFGLSALIGRHAKRSWIYAVLILATWQTYFLGFAFGMILADLVSQERVRSWVARRGWMSWGSILLVGLLLGGYPGSGSTAETVYRFVPNPFDGPIAAIATYHSIAAILVVMSVVGWTRAQRVLNWRPFVILGRQSFSLYLLHLMVIASFSSYLFSQLIQSHGYRTSFVLMLIPSLLIIFTLSYLYTYWVDRPSIMWARRFAKPKPTPAAKPTPKPAQPTLAPDLESAP